MTSIRLLKARNVLYPITIKINGGLRLLKVSTVLVPVDVKVTGHLSQITEGV